MARMILKLPSGGARLTSPLGACPGVETGDTGGGNLVSFLRRRARKWLAEPSRQEKIRKTARATRGQQPKLETPGILNSLFDPASGIGNGRSPR
jgi:hypothetical protein